MVNNVQEMASSPVPFALLDGVPAAERARILGIARRQRFARGEVVCHAGAEADGLHLVEAGRFSIRSESPDGHAALLSVVGAGGFFGELALLGPSRRSATVVAVEPSTTLVVARRAFTELRDRYPSIDRALTATLGARIRELSAQLVDAMYTPVEARLCARLLDASRKWDSARLPFTQQDVADLTGTTRPTANRVLRQLAQEGLIDLSRASVVVVDADALRQRAERWASRPGRA